MIIPDESYIDMKYRLWMFKVLGCEPESKVGHPNVLQRVTCPICDGRNGSMVWMPHKKTWKFLCDTKNPKNCHSHMEFPVLLRAWNPSLFKSYQQERLEAGTTGAGFNCPRPQPGTRRRAPLAFPSSGKHQIQNQPVGISTSP